MHGVVTQDPLASRGSCDCLNVLWIPLYAFVLHLPYCGFSGTGMGTYGKSMLGIIAEVFQSVLSENENSAARVVRV